MSVALTPGGSLTKEGRDKALELLAAARPEVYSREIQNAIDKFLAEVGVDA